MKTIEYRTQLPDELPEGEWKNEYDKKQWLDKRTGLPCLVVRAPHIGSLCGYVGVPESHPFFGKQDDECGYIPAYWGITFADKCAKMPSDIEKVREDLREKVREHGPEAFFVCHKVEKGDNENVWWFGFDCAHCDDLMPSMIEMMRKTGKEFGFSDFGTYKNVTFVEGRVQELALFLRQVDISERGLSKRTLYRKMRFPYSKSVA